jgi:hypothetical protein
VGEGAASEYGTEPEDVPGTLEGTKEDEDILDGRAGDDRERVERGDGEKREKNPLGPQSSVQSELSYLIYRERGASTPINILVLRVTNLHPRPCVLRLRKVFLLNKIHPSSHLA